MRAAFAAKSGTSSRRASSPGLSRSPSRSPGGDKAGAAWTPEGKHADLIRSLDSLDATATDEALANASSMRAVATSQSACNRTWREAAAVATATNSDMTRELGRDDVRRKVVQAVHAKAIKAMERAGRKYSRKLEFFCTSACTRWKNAAPPGALA